MKRSTQWIKSSAPFSPLFIGEYSATRWRAPSPSAARAFQSPLHRGILCNRCRAHRCAAGDGDFQSPLHRGILCNDYRATKVRIFDSAFQSPLHRGILCNARRGRRASDQSALSVPSSSGNTLQQHQFARALRGAGLSVPSSSGNTLQRQDWALLPPDPILSVPSSSGNTLQLAGRATPGLRPAPFSPLFIGEYSATINGPVRALDQIRLSVPSSSGNTLQPLVICCIINKLQSGNATLLRNKPVCTRSRPVFESASSGIRKCPRNNCEIHTPHTGFAPELAAAKSPLGS